MYMMRLESSNNIKEPKEEKFKQVMFNLIDVSHLCYVFFLLKYVKIA